MVQLPTPRCAVGHKCMELMRHHEGAELLRLVAECTADEWSELYKPKVFKARPPEIMERYQQIRTEKERDVFNKDNPDWLKGEDMEKYANHKRWIKSENKSNRHYLEDTLQRLKGDEERSTRIRIILSLYDHVKN